MGFWQWLVVDKAPPAELCIIVLPKQIGLFKRGDTFSRSSASIIDGTINAHLRSRPSEYNMWLRPS